LVKDSVKEIVPYSTLKGKFKIRLDGNENPYDLPLSLKNKVLEKIKKVSFNRYPDPSALSLRERLTEYVKVDLDELVIGNGSDELILNILLTFGKKNCKVIISSPTFSMYKLIARAVGLEIRNVGLDEHFEIVPERVMATRARNKILFLGYPNNPTGNCFDREKIISLLENFKGIIVIDEAYYEFSGRSFLPQLKNYQNLIILRSFSKALGCAGIRVGYLISHREIIKELLKVKLPYNVNSISQVIAEEILNYQNYLQEKIREILEQREYLTQKLKGLKLLRVFNSDTNFILCKIPHHGNQVYRELLDKGIVVRNFNGEPRLQDCLRITIGTPSQNKLLLREMKKIWQEKLKI
jgi:histidinol-phosphate aminotransferase